MPTNYAGKNLNFNHERLVWDECGITEMGKKLIARFERTSHQMPDEQTQEPNRQRYRHYYYKEGGKQK
jgi:hypothetical protein